jgi:PAS domain S-box-containing protein
MILSLPSISLESREKHYNPITRNGYHMPGSHPVMERNLSLEKIDLHDHVACFYRNETERVRLIAKLVRIGMERNERCFCLMSQIGEAQVRQGLRDLGVKENEVRYSPSLVFLKAEEFFLGGNGFATERCLDGLIDMVRAAEGEGYGGARFICDAAPIVRRIGYEQFGQFESCWNDSVDTENISCICLYDSEGGSHVEVLGAVSTHPSLVVRGFVCRNFFYHPPEEFALTGSAFPEAKQLLEKILDIQISELSMADEDAEETNMALEDEVARRERAEMALREAQALQMEVLDGLEDGVCVLDLEQRVLIVNEAFERFRGSCGSKGQVSGQMLAQIWPFRVEEVTSLCDRVIWSGTVERQRMVHQTEGGVAWYDLRIAPITRGGRVDRILLVLHDATLLHQAKMALDEIWQRSETGGYGQPRTKENWERLVATLDQSSLPILVQDREGGVLYANLACGSLFGYSPEEIVGRPSTHLLIPDLREAFHLDNRALEEGEEVSLWAEIRHKDGTMLPCSVRLVGLDGGNGNFLAVMTRRDRKLISQLVGTT